MLTFESSFLDVSCYPDGEAYSSLVPGISSVIVYCDLAEGLRQMLNSNDGECDKKKRS